ncbi:N4-gp56 family major capsid protein [Paratractidigestivibacter sp.]|uniref:N4-gp56 family major capsid protein n=1 Tax=Paratractidigestivibacter sp. TaxID=2847316 RepID=UPI002AC9AAA8|nr:N4-gp56 family major capsid protein [Paratractidigestivibacter sp.]
MDDLTLINNTSVYRSPAAQSPLQGPNVMQPPVVYSQLMLRTIELAESDMLFDRIAEERTMPSNNGANEIMFKRMLSIAAHTQPLVEGLPPASDQGRMVAIKGTCRQYGRVMKFTDKVDWAVVDPLISEYTRQLSLKVPETKDLLAQEALFAECQNYYAAPKVKSTVADDDDVLVIDTSKAAPTHITGLDATCNPSIDELRIIVLAMKTAKVDPRRGSNFDVFASAATIFDLVTDKRIKEYMKWNGNSAAYGNNSVVTLDLFNLNIIEAKTIKQDNSYVDADGVVQYLYITSKGTVVHSTLKDMASAQAGTLYKGVSTAYTLGSGETLTAQFNVHHSLVIGNEALFRIGVQGHTSPEFISKPLGSAGTEDPLNQRQSIGWKLDSLGYKVVNPDAVVDYMAIPSQYKYNTNVRPDTKYGFTDYQYGYADKAGNFYWPGQVDTAIDSSTGKYKYFVRGTTTEVEAIKMTDLVHAVRGGKIGADGAHPEVKGNVPTYYFYLASDTTKTVRFLKEQVELHTDGKYYIAGKAGTAAFEVKRGDVEDPNATGDSRIDR